MKFRKSITVKFLAALFVILVVGQSLGTLLLVSFARTELFSSLENRMRRTAAMTAGVSSGPLISFDYAPLDTFVSEIMKDADITSVRILDNDGKVVKESARQQEGSRSPGNAAGQTGLSVRYPVVAGGSPVGAVVLGYSSSSISRKVTESILTIVIYQIALFVVVGVTVILLFNKDVKKPVAGINGAIEKITRGELTTDVPYPGDNEIGSISRGIAFLEENLASTVSKLNSTAVNVSMAIKQVDLTYKNMITGITKQSEDVQDIIKTIHRAKKAQSDIYDSADKLAGLSAENVSSLIELKATAEEITSNTQRLFKATEDSYSVVAQMTHTAKEIAKNSGEALSAIEDTSASVEEIGASVREVEEHAKETSSMADKVKEITSAVGMMAVVNAVEGMEKIAGEVKESAAIIERLGTRSSDIEKVLSVIKDVTEQTNLLSLNAAILAAQAGEYGKSFSVVADEISALSERTARSTREIGGIVKTIQKDIKDAVYSVESAKTRVSEGNSLVLEVGTALREILDASTHSSEMTKAIERATEEQSLGLGQITSAVEDIRKMMNSIAKATSEQDSALSYLLEGVGEVKEVADLSKRGTEEQAIGTRGISRNLELANDRITSINEAVLDQKELNDALIVAMEQINSRGTQTIRDMEEVSLSLNTLFKEIEVLKKEMEVFKTG